MRENVKMDLTTYFVVIRGGGNRFKTSVDIF
jgi:hypothetical protein